MNFPSRILEDFQELNLWGVAAKVGKESPGPGMKKAEAAAVILLRVPLAQGAW